MKYERFEDLPVWKAAIDLAQMVYLVTREKFFAQPGDLRDQLRRAALSVSNNIAEGFERGSTSELLAFLYIARGSCGEVRSMLHFCQRLIDKDDPKSDISNFKSQISDMRSLAESCSRQIRGWADSLRNGDIKGQRHLTDKSKEQYHSQKRSDAFWRENEEAVMRMQEERLRKIQEERESQI